MESWSGVPIKFLLKVRNFSEILKNVCTQAKCTYRDIILKFQNKIKATWDAIMVVPRRSRANIKLNINNKIRFRHRSGKRLSFFFLNNPLPLFSWKAVSILKKACR